LASHAPTTLAIKGQVSDFGIRWRGGHGLMKTCINTTLHTSGMSAAESSGLAAEALPAATFLFPARCLPSLSADVSAACDTLDFARLSVRRSRIGAR